MRSAPRFFRYRDLDAAALNVEYQIHTVRTDGKATVRDILAVAREKGLAAIAFTEHVRKETSWFADFVREVRDAGGDYPEIKVYVGCETKAMDMDGNLDVTDAILDACDIVLGSVHRFPDGRGGYHDFKALPAEEVAEMEFKLALGMARHAPIDVLAHPGGMYERRHGAFPKDFFRELMVTCLERKIAMEINSSYIVDMEGYLALCNEVDPYVSIGSDAHSLEELGRCRDRLRALGVARQ